MTAKWTDFVAGAVLTAAQLNDVLDNFQDVAIFNETQANGTSGGTFTSGSFTKRTLNTTVVNNIASCTLSSSVISLPAGTYQVTASAPAFQVNSHKIRLQNTSDATTIALGQNCRSNSGGGTVTHSLLKTVFTLAATKNLELQHRAENTVNTNGLGVADSFSVDEIYSLIEIRRIA
jgi:hypothetical protein